MTVVRQDMGVGVDQVFDILADGWLYPVWVVGASHLRDVDTGWPQPGSRLR